jgi:hypothetical protein
MNNLAGTPMFFKKGVGMHQKGVNAPLLSEKEVPTKFTILKCTNRVFLWYWLVKYQENTN